MASALLLCLGALAVSAAEAPRPAAPPALRRKYEGTVLFSVANSVNGGLLGAVGPALPAFGKHTGLGESALGRLVLVNRVAKLLGTLMWTIYARRLQDADSQTTPPRVPLCACMLLATASALIIAAPALRASSLALQIALAVFGASYGFTDPAFTQLTLWGLQDCSRAQRTHVAYLNAGYTLGALATPALVALSLSLGGSCYVSFRAVATVAGLAAVALAISPAVDQGATALVRPRADGAKPDRLSATADRSARLSRWVVCAMAVVLFCVTGCEHGVATWLPTFAAAVGGVPLERGAIISSVYWGAICAGRVAWAAFSHSVASGFAVLGVDGATMLLSSLCFALFAAGGARGGNEWQLWAGALLMALGFASSLPCAITMPAEVGVTVTPSRLLLMNLAGSAGESLMPFVFGSLFERRRYGAFGATLAALNVVVLCTTALVHRTTRSERDDERPAPASKLKEHEHGDE